MGGLATALALSKEGFTHIDIYETASDLGFVGAGIQLAPNMARILDRLGVWEPIAKDATALEGASIRSEQYSDVISGHIGLIQHVNEQRAQRTRSLPSRI